jgi:multiple sugar transport system ATP-binding protein
VPAEVVVIEPMGSETQLTARIGGQNVAAIFRDRISAKPGETIPLQVRPDLIHIFDGQSGCRLS